MTQCKDLNSDMTSGYVHIDITYFFYLSIRIKLYYFVIYNHVISVNVADFLFCVCYFKKIQKNVRIIRKALFALGLRSRIWRESSRRKMTLRPVNTPTGGQMKQTVEASKTAPLFFAFFTTERMTYAYIWCPFVKWIQPCIRNFYWIYWNKISIHRDMII